MIKNIGRFQITIQHTDTGEETVLPWTDNVVTDNYFTRVIWGEQWGYIIFGTGSTPPTQSDTALEAKVAGQVSAPRYFNQATYSKTRDGNVYTALRSNVYEGDVGGVRGNLSELGASFNAAESGMYTRALIKDALGQPTTITVGEFDKLIVTYAVGWSVDLTAPFPAAIDINGTVINGAIRWCNTDLIGSTTGSFWDYTDGYGAESPMSSAWYLAPYGGTVADHGLLANLTVFHSQNFNPDKTAEGTSHRLTISTADVFKHYPPGTATGVWNGLLLGSADMGLTTLHNAFLVFEFDTPYDKTAATDFTYDTFTLDFLRGAA